MGQTSRRFKKTISWVTLIRIIKQKIVIMSRHLKPSQTKSGFFTKKCIVIFEIVLVFASLHYMHKWKNHITVLEWLPITINNNYGVPSTCIFCPFQRFLRYDGDHDLMI